MSTSSIAIAKLMSPKFTQLVIVAMVIAVAGINLIIPASWQSWVAVSGFLPGKLAVSDAPGNTQSLVRSTAIPVSGVVVRMGVRELGASWRSNVVVINGALQTMKGEGGGMLILDPGIYNLTAPIKVPSRTALVGSGPATILRYDGINGFNHMIENENYYNSSARDSNIVLANFTIEGNRGRTGSGGIGFRNIDHVSITNVSVFNCFSDGVAFNPSTVGEAAGGTATDVFIKNVQVNGCGADGFAFKGMTDLRMHDVLARSNGDRARGSGITILRGPNRNEYNYHLLFENVTTDANLVDGVSMKASYFVLWKDSVFSNSAKEDGFVIRSQLWNLSDVSAPSGYVNFVNSSAYGNSEWGFHLTGAGIHDVYFKESVAHDNGRDGFLAYNVDGDIALVNSSSYRNGRNGLFFGGDATASMSNLTVVGGQYYDNSLANPRQYSGLYIEQWSNVTISDVKSFDDQKDKTQAWGIFSRHGVYVAIVNNDLRGNAVGPLSATGSYITMKHNLT